jgi:hypothetical protein
VGRVVAVQACGRAAAPPPGLHYLQMLCVPYLNPVEFAGRLFVVLCLI